MRFFNYLPKTEFSNNVVTNIMVRSKVRDMVLQQAINYYPYRVKEHDRPDIIAHKYYGNSDYTWVIFYANNILDPFYDWPLTYQQFTRYLNDKYDLIRQENTTRHHYKDTADITQDVDGSTCTTVPFTQRAIKEFRNSDGLVIDTTTYQDITVLDKTIVTLFDWEEERNEAKKNIKIIDAKYLTNIITEMKRIYQ